MFEVKVIIEAPELSSALNNLAAAIGGVKPQLQMQQTPAQMPTPTQPVPASTPMSMPQPPAGVTPGSAGMPAPTNAPTSFQAPAAPVQAAPTPFQAPAALVQAAPMQFQAPAAPLQPQQPAGPVAGVPLAGAPQFTVDQIMAAGATLMDAGKVNELMNLLHSFGVNAVMDLKPEQIGAFATELRKLGAAI